MRGAFVTYNSIGDGNLSSGWHERNGNHALLLQNTKGFAWAFHENTGDVRTIEDLPEGYFRSDTPHVGVVTEQIEQLWEQLVREIDTLDFLVIYVGSTGSKRFIELAKELPAEKITFVACDCDLVNKTNKIFGAGLQGAGRLLCECGGNKTMGELLHKFLDDGLAPIERLRLREMERAMNILMQALKILSDRAAQA